MNRPTIRHLAIFVRDVDKVAEFYQSVFQMDLIKKAEATATEGKAYFLSDGYLTLAVLPQRLAGEVAFARSVLETKRDARAAAGLLDWSRLLAPGGLVEEAALRREIALLAEAKDVTRLAMLTRQYVTRFAASLYATDFLSDLAGAIARLGLADDPANYKRLSSAVAERVATLFPDTTFRRTRSSITC